MTLLVVILVAIAAVALIGRQTRARMERGGGETELAIRKIREERKKRHG